MPLEREKNMKLQHRPERCEKKFAKKVASVRNQNVIVKKS